MLLASEKRNCKNFLMASEKTSQTHTSSGQTTIWRLKAPVALWRHRTEHWIKGHLSTALSDTLLTVYLGLFGSTRKHCHTWITPDFSLLGMGLCRPSGSVQRHGGSLKHAQTNKHWTGNTDSWTGRNSSTECGTAEPPEAICQEAICLPSGCPPSSCAISRVLRQFTRMGEDDRTVGRSQKDCRTKGYGRANGQVNTYAWAPW